MRTNWENVSRQSSQQTNIAISFSLPHSFSVWNSTLKFIINIHFGKLPKMSDQQQQQQRHNPIGVYLFSWFIPKWKIPSKRFSPSTSIEFFSLLIRTLSAREIGGDPWVEIMMEETFFYLGRIACETHAMCDSRCGCCNWNENQEK